MTEEKIGELYARLAFQHESALDSLIAKSLIDQELADGGREKFYASLNEEKLRTYEKIGSYTEIIRRYMRRLVCKDMVSLTELAVYYGRQRPSARENKSTEAGNKVQRHGREVHCHPTAGKRTSTPGSVRSIASWLGLRRPPC